MKRIIFKQLFVAFFLSVSCFLLTSCKDTDYRKACEEHDFAKAYKIADKLKDGYRNKERQEALHYIVLQEALYVLEQQGEAGILRLGVIMKENKAYWLPSELLDIVRQTNDEALIECLEKLDESSGNYLLPESISLIGVLNAYFEIVDEKCKLIMSEDEIDNSRILMVKIRYVKQIPQSVASKWKKEHTHPSIKFNPEYLDRSKNYHYEVGDAWASKSVEDLLALKMGDVINLDLYMSEHHFGKVKTFRIITELY